MTVATPVRPMTLDRPQPSRPPKPPALQARPIAVAAYPAGVPRWVTFAGRRRRVVAVHDQPETDTLPPRLPRGARRLRVELTGGQVITLVHDGAAWFER